MNQVSKPQAGATQNRSVSEQDEAAQNRSVPERTPDRDLPRADPARDKRRGRTARLLGAGAVLVVAIMVGVGVWSHMATSNDAQQATKTRQAAVPQVRTMQVKADNSPRQVDLPGTMQAFDSSTLYARATGYIARRNVDIGSRVHVGDVLATIAAPDLDQQLSQARAQYLQMQAALQQAIAQRGLAKVTNQRTSRLVTEGWDSRQQGDQDRTTFTSQTAAVGVAQANLAAQLAAVNRLAQLVGFEQVVAPYNGVITARDIDVGSLVSADTSTGSALFSIARADVLRVQVYVPQEYFFGLKDGQDATMTVPELPGRTFHGKVARNAATLGTSTRTLLAEVDVDNRDGVLTPGLYGIVHVSEPREEPVMTVPTQAIVFGPGGLSVAVVEDGKIAMRHLDVSADDGAQVRVRAGLKDGDKVILNPPVNLVAGERVDAS